MHEITPLLRTVLTATGVFAAFAAVLFAWAGFLLEGAGKLDVAGVYFLVAVTVGVSAGFLLRVVWGGKGGA